MIKIISEEEFWGKKYGKIYPHLESGRPYKKLLQSISRYINIKEDDVWLDVGCGAGSLIQLLWQKSKGLIKMIIAFDFSPTMILHTKRRLAKLKPLIPSDKLKLLQLDLSSKLPFEDEQFNGIVSNLVITYINKHEHHLGKDALIGILRELYRVLKPGGTLVWSTPKKGVNFLYVFLGSIFNILNPFHAERLYYGPLILRHARYIEKKAKLGLYNFLSKTEIIEILEQIEYNNIDINTSFAGQALVIKSQK